METLTNNYPVSDQELNKLIKEFDFYYRRKFNSETKFDEFKTDVMLRIFNKIESFDMEKGGNFRGWISTIYNSRYKSFYNVKRNHVTNESLFLTDSEGNESCNFEQDTFKSVDSSIITNESIKVLYTALNGLKSETVRTAVKMFYIEEKTHKEIAAALNIDILYSKTLIWRGIKQLKETMLG